MEKEYLQVLATENEQKIIYEDLVDTEQMRSYDIREFESDTFMLKTPEPIKQNIKFGIFRLGKIKGNLGRRDIYEDR